jgi:hypothetical protein
MGQFEPNGLSSANERLVYFTLPTPENKIPASLNFLRIWESDMLD